MSNFPDFSSQGYQVISELGRNREGGRITWLASDITTGRQVVLKQFCFAQAGSSWSGFNAYQREIQILQQLNHPSIPHYLGAFATFDGFCMIQEYINAPSLAVQRSFEPDEIKRIAVCVLEILVYLQNQIPPVIHKDIKPENILVDEQLNVYLIDFGFARIGSQELSGSSVFKGTPGFIPPEQLRKPTEASDLYSLGTTLICLLTGTASHAILDLTDKNDPYLIHFRHLLPKLSLRFLDWLELMVQPSLKMRFANAKMALEALEPLDIIRVPGVELSEAVLNFQAKKLGEKLTQTITVENVIPETLLGGRWEVAPHPHDPPHTPNSHAWIRVTPTKFAGNKTLCRIQVDTSNLMADKLYKRQLLLHTNAYPEIHPLNVKIQTAPLPIEREKIPYVALAKVFLIYVSAPKLIVWFTAWLSVTMLGKLAYWVGVVSSIVLALILTFHYLYHALLCMVRMVKITNKTLGLIRSIRLAAPLVFTRNNVLYRVVQVVVYSVFFYIVGAASYVVYFNFSHIIDSVFRENLVLRLIANIIYFYALFKICMNALLQHVILALLRNAGLDVLDEYNTFTELLWLFMAGLGTSLGIGWVVGFSHPYILLALAGTGIPLATMLSYPPLKRHRLITKYRKSEQRLIKP